MGRPEIGMGTVPSRARVVVIGAGVVGLATGYELARRGAEVVIATDREPGAGASSNNAGWVVPAESGPVPAPGVILQTLRWMLRPDSPVYVRPELSPSFVRFFAGMLRACTERAYARGFDATAALARGTMDTLDAWAADGLEFEMHADGELRAYIDDRVYRAAVGDLARYKRAGFAFEALSGDDARRAEPVLGDEVVGALRFEGQPTVRPKAVIELWRWSSPNRPGWGIRAFGLHGIAGQAFPVSAAWTAFRRFSVRVRRHVLLPDASRRSWSARGRSRGPAAFRFVSWKSRAT